MEKKVLSSLVAAISLFALAACNSNDSSNSNSSPQQNPGSGATAEIRESVDGGTEPEVAGPVVDPSEGGIASPVAPTFFNGEWERTSTACTHQQNPKANLVRSSFVIDDNGGYVILRYKNGMLVSIPMVIHYPTANTFEFEAAPNSEGNAFQCVDIYSGASQRHCVGYNPPAINTTGTFVVNSDGKATVKLDHDFLCGFYASGKSSSTVQLEVLK